MNIDFDAYSKFRKYAVLLSSTDQAILRLLSEEATRNPKQKYIDYVINNSYCCKDIEEVESFCLAHDTDVMKVKANIIEKARTIALLDFYSSFAERCETLLINNRAFLLLGDNQ